MTTQTASPAPSPSPQELGADVVVYRCGYRPLRHRDKLLQHGDIVEGAADWPRLESWVRTRRILRSTMNVDELASMAEPLPENTPSETTEEDGDQLDLDQDPDQEVFIEGDESEIDEEDV